jgi:hypothetical protein
LLGEAGAELAQTGELSREGGESIDRLNEIAALYDELSAGQDPGPTDRD